MTYRLAIHYGCHWRRLARTGSLAYARRLRRDLAAAGIEVDVRKRIAR